MRFRTDPGSIEPINSTNRADTRLKSQEHDRKAKSQSEEQRETDANNESITEQLSNQQRSMHAEFDENRMVEIDEPAVRSA